MIKEFSERIAVRPSYFALSNMRTEVDDTLAARVPVEQPTENERGTILVAEVGRHLAKPNYRKNAKSII